MSMSGTANIDSNISDFDNSDDDIADLLADDDDDIYAKKLSTSPTKKSKSAEFSPKKGTILSSDGNSFVKRSFDSPILSPKKKSSIEFNSPVKSSLRQELSKQNSDAFESDALSEFLSKTQIPSKTKPKASSPLKQLSDHDESKYLDDLGFSKLSAEATSTVDGDNVGFQKSGGDDFNSDDDDLLKTLESDTDDKSIPNSPRKRSGSFFDDFLQKLSPKHSAKKQVSSISEELEENTKKDIHKKNSITDTVSPEHKTSRLPDENLQKRRESLLKQVSFKNSPEHLPKTVESVKGKSLRTEIQSPKREKSSSTPLPPTKRSEKMAALKDEEAEWLSYFKESPKKNNEKIQTKRDDKEVLSENKLNTRRKSSGAEWLGLSEPNTPTKSSSLALEGKKESFEKGDDWLASSEISNPIKSFSAKENLSRPRRQRAAPTIDTDWFNEDFKTNPLEDKGSDTLKVKSNSAPLSGKSINNITSDHTLENVSIIPTSQSVLNVIKNASTSKPSINKEISPVQTVCQAKQIPQELGTTTSDLHALPSRASDMQPNFTVASIIPPNNIVQNEIGEMQLLMKNYLMEKDQLLKSMEEMKIMYEDRIKSMDISYKEQLKTLEDSFKNLENNLKKETESNMKALEDKLNILKKEKEEMESNTKNKLYDIEKEHMKEVQKLKELHSFSISQMKQDHEDALKRLNRLKEQELEAILSTQSHSRSLQQLSEQLEARTSELAMLQTKVEERNQSTLREKQSLLECKERDLKAMENRLQRQLEDGDAERTRLQQLVLRLENRLQKCTVEGEEDRWDVQQLKAKLTVQQKYLDEEHKLKLEQIEREKEKLQIAQNSLLHEQKVVLLQLAQERQQLTQEKNDMELLSRRIKEEETKFNVKKMKEESYIERQKQFIQQEENRIHSEKNNMKLETQQLERERDLLEREKHQLRDEKERFNEYSMKVKRRSDEIEQMAMFATEEKERARLEQAAAIKIKNEHQSRMQQIAQQMQTLMEKERQILQEKEKLAEERFELESKKSSVTCMKCKLSTQLPVNVPPPNITATPIMTYPSLNGVSNHLPQTFIDPNLVIWQISAQKDHAYLEEELSYLRSLKESSKKSY